MTLILNVLANEFRNDARVLRAARLGVETGADVLVLAWEGPGLPHQETIAGVRVHRVRLRSKPLPRHATVQLVKFGELFARMLAVGIRAKPDLVHANDLTALPLGAAIARVRGVPLLYDSHELWSSVDAASKMPGWLARSRAVLERRLAHRADAVLTVSEGIAQEMAGRLGIPRPTVLRNTPALEDDLPRGAQPDPHSPLRQALGVGPETPVLLYQGALLPRRGLEVLIDAFGRLKRGDAVLALLGSGPLAARLTARLEQMDAGGRARLLPAVPQAALAAWTRGATVGIHPIEATSLNHRLCLPNKLFEYIHAGLPVAVSDLPEMARVVKAYGIGEVFPPGDAVALAASLDRMLASPQAIAGYRRGSERARAELNWDHEKHTLAALYRHLLAAKK